MHFPERNKRKIWLDSTYLIILCDECRILIVPKHNQMKEEKLNLKSANVASVIQFQTHAQYLYTRCLIYLVIFFFRVFEYFTFTVAASIMVGENQALLGGNRPPYTGCCQTFPLTTGQKASINWTWTHGDGIYERLLGHRSLTVKATEPHPLLTQKIHKIRRWRVLPHGQVKQKCFCV